MHALRRLVTDATEGLARRGRLRRQPAEPVRVSGPRPGVIVLRHTGSDPDDGPTPDVGSTLDADALPDVMSGRVPPAPTSSPST